LVVGQFVSRHRISGVRGEGLKTMPPILPIFPNRATGVARTRKVLAPCRTDAALSNTRMIFVSL